jgi:uncharacterized protein YndB with AHSA1/START domain
MGAFQLVINIARPPTEVFRFIAEPRNMPVWYEAVDHVTKTTAGATGTGARYQIRRSLPAGLALNDAELTELIADRRVTLESRGGPTPFRYRYDVEPSPDGTLLTLDAHISSAGLPGPFAHLDRLTTQLFKQGMRQNLHELKRVLESTAAGAA